jgi:hypothetical protein
VKVKQKTIPRNRELPFVLKVGYIVRICQALALVARIPQQWMLWNYRGNTGAKNGVCSIGGRMPLTSASIPTFIPSTADVERYQRLRGRARDLNSKIVKTIPREAIQQVAEAIGRLHQGVLVFDSEDESNVLMDCCLFDWIREGKNLIKKYVENHPPAPGTAEHELLEAYLKAKYRIVVPQSRVEGAGAHFLDLLSGEELFIMDIGLSRIPTLGAYATRTIPLGRFWMTGGAVLPTGSDAIKTAIDRLTNERLVEKGRFTDPHKAALVFVRTLLESGASKHVVYETVENQRRQTLHSESRGAHVPPQKLSAYTPGRNSPCPCGSGKRYKRCCEAKARPGQQKFT